MIKEYLFKDIIFYFLNFIWTDYLFLKFEKSLLINIYNTLFDFVINKAERFFVFQSIVFE